MKPFLQYLAHNKYRLTIFGLLAGATNVCVGLVRFRTNNSGSLHYTFLVWDLFLAWIPFIIAYIAYTTSIQRRWLYAVVSVGTLIWLVFFPNAPYILHPTTRLLIFSSLFTSFFLFVYLILYTFGHLLLERRASE